MSTIQLTPAINPQAQVQSARREAQQAEQEAKTLASRAQDAQRVANSEQAQAEKIGNQAEDAGQRWVAASSRANAVQSNVVRNPPAPPPRIHLNGAGQMTGVWVDTKA